MVDVPAPEAPAAPAEPVAPAPRVGFEDEVQERDYQAASELFQHPPRVQERSRLLLISIVMFLGVSFAQGTQSPTDLAMLVGVLMVHELGHALGMLLFGYRDVRIFFIPLFGAAASGRQYGVAKWKQAVVLLLGPMPGLIAGTILLLQGADGLVRTVAIQLVAINGFNLLPLTPLDGGNLFRLLVFSRSRQLETGFITVAALAMLGGAVYLKLWISAFLGFFMLVGLPIRKKVLALGAELRSAGLPVEPAALDDAQRRMLFAALWKDMPPQWKGKARTQASLMEQVLETATARPAGVAVSLSLILAWAAGIALVVVSVFAFIQGPPADWKRYEDKTHQFTVELPAAAKEEAGQAPGQGVLSARRGRAEFGVTWIPIMAGVDVEGRLRKEYGEKIGTHLRDEPLGGGSSAQVISLSGRETWLLYRTSANRVYIVIASGSREENERVLRSFSIR